MNLLHTLSQSTSGVGVIGAIVGGAGAAAKNYADFQKGAVSSREAVANTAIEATGAGVATVVSAAAVGIVGGGLALSIGTAVGVAAAAKYGWDKVVERAEDRLSAADADLLDEAVAQTD
jgi:ABC-type nitrate/sulfonate/bicarbonate transport system permease component